MKIEKAPVPKIGLSYLEKFVLNTFFVMIVGYIFLALYQNKFVKMNDLTYSVVVFGLFLISAFFMSKIMSLANKSAFICEGKDLWCFYKGGKKYSFECSEISSIKKSFFGLYSSLVIKVQDTKINIPAETRSLNGFISDLLQHLPKEQVSDLLNFHQRAQCVCFEVEKVSIFLRFFCFFIPLLGFFIARNVWELFSMPICILWAFLSLVFPFFWIIIHWILLKITVRNFNIFSRISALWAIFGVLFYMTTGFAYRHFYLWIIYNYQGF
ncbi:MAG: hypothetical protein FWF51_05250 [Chitinivibrionia bacterium]|nr:hypothetical protein [Chitinivibrionia bacterium]